MVKTQNCGHKDDFFVIYETKPSDSQQTAQYCRVNFFEYSEMITFIRPSFIYDTSTAVQEGRDPTHDKCQKHGTLCLIR